MGNCIQKLPHSCGTKKGLQVFVNDKGLIDGYCFACNTAVKNPYGEEKKLGDIDLPPPKSEEEIQEELQEVHGYPTVDIPSRKLRESSLKQFNVKVALSENDGITPICMYFPITKKGKLTGYYAKTLGDRKFTWSIGDVKEGDLFGWEQAKVSGAYKLIITEGLEDAVAAYTINKLYGKEEYMPAIVSLPNGVNSVGKVLSRMSNTITRTFREVILCFDDDEPGHKAVEEAMLILPEAKSVTLPSKDANDCLMKGVGKAAYKAMSFDAQRPKNTRLIFGSDLHERAKQPAQYGELTWPWEKMQNLLKGVRLGETTYIGAGVKMGKSEIAYSLAAHFIKNDKVGVFIAAPEENENELYKAIAGHIVGEDFRNPDTPFNEKEYDKAGKIVSEGGDKLITLDLYQHVGWDTLKADIIAAANHGVKVVMIDPITNLTAGMSASDANTFLTGMARDISAIAKDKNLAVFLFCHLKAPEGNIDKDLRRKKYSQGQYTRMGNCPHERGGDVLSTQFTGSRAMMQACNLMLGLEGNRDDELPEDIRATRWLSILEDRKFGNSDSVRLFRNKYTTQFKEV